MSTEALRKTIADKALTLAEHPELFKAFLSRNIGRLRRNVQEWDRKLQDIENGSTDKRHYNVVYLNYIADAEALEVFKAAAELFSVDMKLQCSK